MFAPELPGDTSGMHGYTLWSKRGAPKADHSRVVVLEVVSAKPGPGARLQCDGTWITRFRTYPRHDAKDARNRERAELLAEKLGAQVTEREISTTLADMWGIR